MMDQLESLRDYCQSGNWRLEPILDALIALRAGDASTAEEILFNLVDPFDEWDVEDDV